MPSLPPTVVTSTGSRHLIYTPLETVHGGFSPWSCLTPPWLSGSGSKQGQDWWQGLRHKASALERWLPGRWKMPKSYTRASCPSGSLSLVGYLRDLWSVRTVTFILNKYSLKWVTTVKGSLLVMQSFCSAGDNLLLTYARTLVRPSLHLC